MNDLLLSDPAAQAALDLASSPETIQAAYISFLVIMAWSTVWKAIAMWKAARKNSKPWFIALLLINTVGILEIVYIFYISKKTDKTEVEDDVQTKEEILDEVTRN